MYSYEDRIKAVRLYLKLGKRLGVTIRQLGYPTKNTLIGWYREFIDKQALRDGYTRARDRFTVVQKQHAVEHHLDHGRCIAFTLRVLGYPSRATFSKWLDELHPDVRMRMVGRAPNVQHPMEIKKAAVLELCIRDTSSGEIAKKVKVCRPTLYNWKSELLGPEAPALINRHHESTPDPNSRSQSVTELQQQVDVLELNIRRLQLEHDLLKKANELLKKDQGVAPQLLGNRDKAMLVDALKHIYSLTELLAELALARSSYFYHCSRLRMPGKYAAARVAMVDIFQSNYRCYGYRRIHSALLQRQLHISEKVV